MTNFSALAQRLGLEEDEYIELVELFVNTSDTDLNKIEISIGANDPEGTAKAAHSLKGSSGSLGFDAISEAAMKIEKNAREGSLEGAVGSVEIIKDKIRALAALISQ